MVLPSTVQNNLDKLTEYHFGGYAEVIRLLTNKELEYIINYPGYRAIISPVHYTINLARLGKPNRESYDIFDAELNHLYSVLPDPTSTDQNLVKFGLDPRDRIAITATKHGGYIHIGFKGVNTYILVLVWISKSMAPHVRRELIKQYVEKHKYYVNASRKDGQLFISNPEQYKVYIYHIPGRFDSRYTVEDLIGVANVEELLITYDDQIILHVARSGWYAILVDDKKPVPCYLEIDTLDGNVKQPGQDRIYQRNGLIYINLEYKNLDLVNIDFQNNSGGEEANIDAFYRIDEGFSVSGTLVKVNSITPVEGPYFEVD